MKLEQNIKAVLYVDSCKILDAFNGKLMSSVQFINF